MVARSRSCSSLLACDLERHQGAPAVAEVPVPLQRCRPLVDRVDAVGPLEVRVEVEPGAEALRPVPELARGGEGRGPVGLRQRESEVEDGADPVHEGLVHGDDLDHLGHGDHLRRRQRTHGEISLRRGGEHAVDLDPRGELDLVLVRGGEGPDLGPLDGQAPGVVGVEVELAPGHALDLAGEVVAVPDDDDVGLLPRGGGEGGHEQRGGEEGPVHQGAEHSASVPGVSERCVHPQSPWNRCGAAGRTR